MDRATTATTPELLAPAGGPLAFRAAVNNGADAVYAGLGTLNARRGAENFTAATLADACRFAHLRGVKVYLTANVLVLPDEMAGALNLIDEAWSVGVDAVIVQDLGLLCSIRASMPHVRVHASTQLNAHNSATIEELGRLGVSRVTLGRETSVTEIARFVAASHVEVESFVHGALCMCYSGQCLLSSLIGARSANRGLCAQPCRLPYELLDDSGRALATEGAHLLSPKDLAGIAMLPSLVAAGVAALKIEGRMKSPEYVALVTGVYRAALDRAATLGEEFEVRDAEQQVLEEAFSRGFTTAYLSGERGNEMMSYRRPNNRGVPVGRVSATQDDRATIAIDTAIESGDTLEFWTAKGRFAQRVGALEYGNGEHSAAPAGTRVTIAVDGATRAGDRVFRVANASLLAAARRTFSAQDAGPAMPLAIRVGLRIGAPLSVDVADASGRVGSARGGDVEPARTKAVSVEDVMEHVGRLGATPYVAGSWDIDLSSNAGVGFSELHRVRREAIEDYEAAVLAPWRPRHRVRPDVPRVVSPSKRRAEAPRLVASVERLSLARVALDAGADLVHVPVWELTEAALADQADLSTRIVPLVPRIIHDREVPTAEKRIAHSRRVVIGNLGMLAAAKRARLVVESHWGLNAINQWTVAALADAGVSLVWLSPELSGRQTAVVAGASRVPVGVAVYGRQEVMVTEHCILMSEGECSRNCAECERRATPRFLRDRKGYRFPVTTDPTGRSHLFNAVALDLVMEIPGLLEAGVTSLRLDFAVESAEDVSRITRQVRRTLDSVHAGEARLEPVVQPATTGHYFRGVR
jgi:putative protease